MNDLQIMWRFSLLHGGNVYYLWCYRGFLISDQLQLVNKLNTVSDIFCLPEENDAN